MTQWSPLQTNPGDNPAPAVPETPAFPWKALLAGIWLTGAAAMLGYGAVTWFRLCRRVRFAVRVSGRVWEDDTVSSPFILGLFRPRIYLPSGLEGRARRFILCHEFAHLRRLDHVVKPLCWLALAVHWFNPAVWLAFLLLSRDMEGACDEAVLRSLGEDAKAGYSYTLLALASGKRIPAPCPLAFDEGDAKGRIKNVLNYRRPALWVVVMSVLAVVVAAVCLLTDPVAAEVPVADSPAPTQSEPGPSQTPEATPAQVPAEAWKDLVGVNYFLGIPVDPAVNVSVPWFLDMDQQRRYQWTYSLYSHLFGADTSAIDEWEWSGSEPLPPAEPVEVDGYTYSPSTGRYARWEDLEKAALSVFTPEFWQTRNTWLDDDGNSHQIFTNVDGRTYYLDASRGSHGTNPNFPDTFHLPTQSDTEISFVLVGHYSEIYPQEGESFEERDARLADHWETYCGFPMKLVLTENGWRFDEFYCANTDEGNAAYSAPNPALTGDPTPEAGACVHGLDHVYVDHLTDGRLVYRCQEDFFPYYPPYPGAYNSEGTGEGDYDGDGHIEEIVTNSTGTLMLCDVVDGELRTCTFDPRTLTDGYPDADISAAWIEPGDEPIYCVPLRDEPNGYPTGTVQWTLRYDGASIINIGPMVISTHD